MSPKETTPAILLRSVNYKESDKIVTLLTRSMGRISAMARGARKSQKRFGGALEPFTLFEVTLAKHTKTGNLWHIQESLLLEANEGISKDLERVGAASYLIELLREIIPDDDPDMGLFLIAEESLLAISRSTGAPLAKTVLAAELRITAQAGTEVGLSACNACGTVVPKGRPVLFQPSRGGVICTPCGGGPITLSASALAVMEALRAAPLPRAGDVPATVPEIFEIETALHAFIDYHMGRPLPTRSFYRTNRRLGLEE